MPDNCNSWFAAAMIALFGTLPVSCTQQTWAQSAPAVSATTSAAATAAASASASASSAAAGVRTRVERTDGTVMTGTLVQQSGDSVVVLIAGYRHAIPSARIRTIQVSTGRRRHAAQGLLFGTLAGGGVGAIAGALSYSGGGCDAGSDVCFDFSLFDRADYTLGGAVLGAGIGFVVGLLAGASTVTDRWESVVDNRVRVSASRSPDGALAIGARIAIR